MASKDPVCGMTVDEGEAAANTEHQGRTYYFCSSHCKKEFDTDPNAYVG